MRPSHVSTHGQLIDGYHCANCFAFIVHLHRAVVDTSGGTIELRFCSAECAAAKRRELGYVDDAPITILIGTPTLKMALSSGDGEGDVIDVHLAADGTLTLS